MEEDIRIYGDRDSQSRLLPLKILSEVNMRMMMQFADSFIASLFLLKFNESAFEDWNKSWDVPIPGFARNRPKTECTNYLALQRIYGFNLYIAGVVNGRRGLHTWYSGNSSTINNNIVVALDPPPLPQHNYSGRPSVPLFDWTIKVFESIFSLAPSVSLAYPNLFRALPINSTKVDYRGTKV